MLLENEKEIEKTDNGEMEKWRGKADKGQPFLSNCSGQGKTRGGLGQITAVSALNGMEWAGSRL